MNTDATRLASLLEVAVGAADAHLVVLDEAGVVLAASRGFGRLLDSTPERMLGCALPDLLAVDERQLVLRALETARGTGRFEGELPLPPAALPATNLRVRLSHLGGSATGPGFLLELAPEAGGEADSGRVEYVRLITGMERIERAMRGAGSLREMLLRVLDATLALFECDRAWLLHPCDPDAATLQVPMERTVPEFPGAFELDVDIPMSEELAVTLRTALDSDGPIVQGPGAPQQVTQYVAERFAVRSLIGMVVHPQVGKPWMFGLHQCSYARRWTEGEIRIVREIGRRLADGLTSMLTWEDRVASEHRFRTLFEQAADAVFLIAQDGRILDVNRRACDSLGYSRLELLERPVDSIARMDAGSLSVGDAWSRLSPGETAFSIGTHRRKDGSEFPVEASLGMIEIDGQDVVLAWVRDVSARRQAERERERLEGQLRRAQRMEALGRLAAGIAHDFNNMLLPILGYAELLPRLQERGDLSGPIEGIRTAAERCKDLTRQLLTLGRNQVLELRSTDLSATVEGMTHLLRRTLREDVVLEVDLPDCACTVLADQGQVEQMVMNLALNAQDAMPDGGRLEVRVERSDLTERDCAPHPDGRPGAYCILTVADSGHGMDEETLRQAFDPFFTTKGDLGTGLGLATVHAIATQHGGHVWASSTPGRGTTFRIYLPSERGTRSEREEEDDSSIRAGTETVLLVEDEDLVRRVTAELLLRHGYRVLPATGGEDALRLVTEHDGPIDLLLTDVIMPGMNGRELAERVVALHPEVRVVFMSGYTGNVIAHHGILEADVRLVHKPFSGSELVRALRKALEEP